MRHITGGSCAAPISLEGQADSIPGATNYRLRAFLLDIDFCWCSVENLPSCPASRCNVQLTPGVHSHTSLFDDLCSLFSITSASLPKIGGRVYPLSVVGFQKSFVCSSPLRGEAAG